MMYSKKALLLTAGVLGSSFIYASSADVSLTNDMIKGGVNLDVGPFALEAGGTNDVDENITSGYAGISVQDSESSGPLQVGIGARIYAVDTNWENEGSDSDNLTLAAALGGWYRYTVPQANRLSIYASGYYSPEVLAISNIEHMYTYEVRGEYMTAQNARAYVSYGKTVYVNDDGERRVSNKGIAVGVSVDF